jgi:hypothetical protein
VIRGILEPFGAKALRLALDFTVAPARFNITNKNEQQDHKTDDHRQT